MRIMITDSRTVRTLTALLFGAMAQWSGLALAGMINKDGMADWETCALCHGADGISAMAKFPKLAGQKRQYIEKQYRDFHQARRTNDGGQMQSISEEVGIAGIASVASYFSNLPALSASTVEDQTQYKAGKIIFENGRPGVVACTICHADANSTAPWIDRQHSAYLQKQLVDFRNGERANDANSEMRSIATLLTIEEIGAVSLYLSAAAIERTK